MNENRFKPVSIREIVNEKRKNGAQTHITNLPTDFFLYRPKLYKQLSLPSYVHGYSLAIEYMRDWFLAKFPKEYFKTVYINGKHVLSDWKKFNNYNIKREKPMLSIVPTIEYDFNRENIDLYQGNEHLFLKTSDYEQSFLKDFESKQYLYCRMRALKMTFAFRARFNTRSEQLDALNRMELCFKIGSTWHDRCSIDFHIPESCIIGLACKAGFELVKNPETGKMLIQKKDICDLTNYLNRHSHLPIICKMRGINQQPAYFMRIDDLYTHISCLNKLQPNDGDQVGKLYDNYDIEMEAVLTIPIPHFFVLFEEEYIGNELTVYDKDPETSISLYTVNPFQIPPVNEKGWAQFALTSYMTDKNEKTIDISSILNGGGNITQVIDYTIKMGLDPRMFIDTKVYLSQQFDQARCVDIRVDYGKKIICLENPVDEELMLNLVFYADMKYVNESIITMNNINDTRIKNQHKD
jgi:hypothetical protein